MRAFGPTKYLGLGSILVLSNETYYTIVLDMTVYISVNPSNYFQPCSRIVLVCSSVCPRMIADRLYSNWIAEKKIEREDRLTGKGPEKVFNNYFLAPTQKAG